MNDRPSANELLDAVQMHLRENLIPIVRQDRKLYFQTLVAINVLKIVGREVEQYARNVRSEWKRLNALEEVSKALRGNPAQVDRLLAERNRQLAADIHDGQYDDAERKAELLDHLIATTEAQLLVANPDFLERLAEEDAG